MIKSYIKNGSERLLVVIVGGLGDCILMTPYIEHLAKTGSYQKIDILAPAPAKALYQSADYLSSYTAITHVKEQLSAIYHAKDYDCLNNLGLARKASVAGVYCHDLLEQHFGFTTDRKMRIALTPENEAWAEELLAAHDKPGILITTEAGWDDKRYPLSQWQQIVNKLSETHTILEVATEPSGLDNVHYISPLPDLGRTATLTKHVDLVICPDTYLGHMAAAVDTPAVVLFGPTSPTVWGHPANSNLSSDSCTPCTAIDDQFKTRNACTDNRCLGSITPVDILRHCASAAT